MAVISPDEAIVVLNEWVKDSRIRKRTEEIALALASDIDIDSVAKMSQGRTSSLHSWRVLAIRGITREEKLIP